jgi:hypothetical protein
MMVVEKRALAILERALEIDVEAGVVVGDKKAWAKAEVREGIEYTKEMGNSFFNIIKPIKMVTSTTVDRNEDLIAWKDKYDIEYKGMSETAKVAATIQYLRGFDRFDSKLSKARRGRAPKVLPPASNSRSEYQLLHEKGV